MYNAQLVFNYNITIIFMQNIFQKRILATIGMTLVMIFAVGTVPLVSRAVNTCTSATGGNNSDAFASQINGGSITYNTVIDATSKKATATVKNTSECDYTPVSISVYKMFDQKLSTQQLFSTTQGTLNKKGELNLSVDLPPCMAQIDLWYGTAPQTLLDSDPYWTSNYNPRIFDGKFYLNNGGSVSNASGPFCTNEPTVTVEKTGPATATADSEVSYTLTVKNTGNIAATQGIYLTDRVDAALTFVRASSADCKKDTASRDVVCSRAGTLAVGESVSYTLTFKVVATAACESIIPNKVDISVPYGVGGYVNAWSNMTSTKVACAPPVELTCAPALQTIDINQTANFAANGGTGTYTWSAPGANTTSGTGKNFSTVYPSNGTRTVAVTSGSKSATCNVVVTSTPTGPSLFCNPPSQNVSLGQIVNLTASGGNSSYTWYAPEGNLSTNSGNSVNVSYTTTGVKTVTVNSNGLTASCALIVNQITGGGSNLSLTKLVRDVTQGTTFLKNISNVRGGDVLEYQIRVRNTGSSTLSGFQVRDAINQSGYLQDFRNLTVSRGFSGDMYGSGMMVLGNLNPGEEFTIGYLYTATASITANGNVCNTITVVGTSVGSVTDTACVSGTGSVAGVSVSLAKSAWNDTKNVNATSQTASREDYITYSLTVRNTSGSDVVGYVITDDLSGILPLADMTDLGGGTLSGQTISYPAINIPVNGLVTKNFRVRVKYSLATNISYQMINTFGNTVTVVINTPQTYTPPKTGGNTNAAAGIGFAGLLTTGFLFLRKRHLARIIFS